MFKIASQIENAIDRIIGLNNNNKNSALDKNETFYSCVSDKNDNEYIICSKKMIKEVGGKQSVVDVSQERIKKEKAFLMDIITKKSFERPNDILIKEESNENTQKNLFDIIVKNQTIRKINIDLNLTDRFKMFWGADLTNLKNIEANVSNISYQN